ncbi:hypothetical protein WICPIJ_007689 [Wickerhamomyces pijperi]|uniref:Zn(2)-C6 fungal-type domain-containing protein n=1 Tax=Wickerhamomyces pijperi TaxID=599730 RepID=A0A9P8TK65_WICPI|nr:hypothetical protein WICPIJ_007689 [Wickerhamomyces pijperi]
MSKANQRKPKQSYSCGNCRRLKTRCDHEIPCSNCVKNNLVQECLATPAKPLTHFKELIKPNTGFGRIIKSSNTNKQTTTIAAKPSTSLSSSTLGSETSSRASTPGQSSTNSTSLLPISATTAQTSSQFLPTTLSQSLDGFNVTPTYNNSASSVPAPEIIDTVPLKELITAQEKNNQLQGIIDQLQSQLQQSQQVHNGNSVANNIPPRQEFSYQSPPLVDFLQMTHPKSESLKNYVLTSVLPPKDIVDFLKEYYFSSGIDDHRLIHVPTFNAQYDIFWSLVHSGNLQESQTKIDQLWIALLFSIISAALVFMPTDLINSNPNLQYFFQNEEYSVLLHRTWFVTSRQLLVAYVDHVKPTRLIQLQINGTVKNYLEATDQLKMLDSLLSESIMDCHYLKLDNVAAYSQLSPLERELRKRIFWCVCVCDTERAFKLGRRPLIHSYLSNVPIPENCDDSGLTTTSIVVEPWGTITDSTGIIVRARICRSINRLYHLHNGCSLTDLFKTVYECDSELFNVCELIPTQWELPLLNDTQKEKLGLNNGIVTEMDQSMFRYRLFEKFLDPSILPIPEYIPQLMCQDAINSVFSNFYSVAFHSNIKQPVDPLSYPRIYKIVNALIFQMVSVLTNKYIIITQFAKDQIEFVLDFLLQLLNKRAIFIQPTCLKNSLPLLLSLKTKVDQLPVTSNLPIVPTVNQYQPEEERVKVGSLVNHLYTRPTGEHDYQSYVPSTQALQENLIFLQDLSKFISLKQLLQNDVYVVGDPELQLILDQNIERVSFSQKHCLGFLSKNEDI